MIWILDAYKLRFLKVSVCFCCIILIETYKFDVTTHQTRKMTSFLLREVMSKVCVHRSRMSTTYMYTCTRLTSGEWVCTLYADALT